MGEKKFTIKITKRAKRKYWYMYWDDPLTGKERWESTKCTTHKDALKKAGEREAEILGGRYSAPSKIEWQSFRERYQNEKLPSLAVGTAKLAFTVFNSLESAVKLHYLHDLTPGRLSVYQSELRKSGKAEATIRSYLAMLRAALKWAERMGMIQAAPKAEMPKRAKGGGKIMKGRPITGEEFDRIIDKVEAGLLAMATRVKVKHPAAKRIQCDAAVVRRKEGIAKLVNAAAPSWRHFLRGLWLSGLRIGEALNLYWDRPDRMHVVMGGRRPMFRIHAGQEKGGKDRLLPMTPDFAEFLLATPEAERTGPVFRPLGSKGRGEVRNSNYASKVISAMGKAAGVKVNETDGGKDKFASAHDLRRSFGARWAPRIMPAVLQQLMRHESIETTMRYYVGQNSDATADAVWEAFGKMNTSMDTSPTAEVGIYQNALF